MAALILLNVQLAVAGGLAETNQMPLPVHTLMDASGHVLVQTNLMLSSPENANSLRVLSPMKKTRFILFKRPAPKPRWNFWNNLGVKYVHRNHDPLNVVAPTQMTAYSALAQFEYDVTYSFDF